MTEELLKSAGVCSRMPVCHAPCQIKAAACRAGYSRHLLNPQRTRVLHHSTGRKVSLVCRQECFFLLLLSKRDFNG